MDEGLVKIRHERSKKDFPGLSLHDGEYVEYAFSRARICLALMWGAIAAVLILVLTVFLFVILGQPLLDDMGRSFLFIIMFTLIAAAVLIGMVSMMVYNGNRLFITNKRAIQTVMTAPMARSMNAIDLSSIEDVSFSENGILQRVFHYGTFRLSTVGDETTYTFPYSDVKPEEMKAISKMVSEAKKRRRIKKEDEDAEIVADADANEKSEEETSSNVTEG